MVINKSSWHYRFNKWKTDWRQTEGHASLCSYFWFTVWNIVCLSVSSLIMTTVLGGIVLALGAIAADALDISRWWSILTGPLTVAFLVGCMILFVVSINKASSVYTEYKRSSVAKDREKSCHKKPGLLKSFLIARKNKMCPLLEFK